VHTAKNSGFYQMQTDRERIPQRETERARKKREAEGKALRKTEGKTNLGNDREKRDVRIQERKRGERRGREE
jgi:hypothetical protein